MKRKSDISVMDYHFDDEDQNHETWEKHVSTMFFCRIPEHVNIHHEIVQINGKNVSNDQLRFGSNTNKWKPGTELTWSFIEDSKWKGDEEVIAMAFDEWSKICNVKFRRLGSKDMTANIRIGFDTMEGCWSYVGTDILRKKYSNQKTMNFGCALLNRLHIPLHEIGHTLGFPHEHQNVYSGIVFDTDAVYAEMNRFGWDKNAVDHNILKKYRGIHDFVWDPESIMNIGIRPNLIIEPAKYREGIKPSERFSSQDKKLAEKFYPFPLKSPLSVGQDQLLRVQLPKDETTTIQLNDLNPEFYISVLLKSDALIEIFIKDGTNITARGTSKSPVKGIKHTNICDYVLELKCISSQAEDKIPATITIY
jgi:hypothetical protein